MAPQGILPLEPTNKQKDLEGERLRRHVKYEFYSVVLSRITGLTFHIHNYEKTLESLEGINSNLPFITRHMCRCGKQGPPTGWLTNMDVNALYPETVNLRVLHNISTKNYFAKEYLGTFDMDSLKDAT